MANGVFKPGDTVKLKSGGPVMTVSTAKDTNGFYYCQWFKGATQQHGNFREETLETYRPPQNEKK